MQIINEMLKNYPLVAALLSMLLGQAFKIVYYGFADKKLDWRHFFESGGMPSAHSAMASSLTVALGISQGWSSAPFAIAVAFASIVIYDAVGVRRATGYQSVVINRITDDLYKTGRINSEKLQEYMGHTPIEAFAGIIFGITVALILYFGVYAFVA